MSDLFKIEIESSAEDTPGRLQITFQYPSVYFAWMLLREGSYADKYRHEIEVLEIKKAIESFLSLMRRELEEAFKNAKSLPSP